MSIFKAFFGLGKIPKVTKFFEFKSFDDVNQMGGAIANIKQQVREGGLQLTKAQQKFLDDQQKQVEMVFELISKSPQSGIRNAESAKIFNIRGQQLDPNKPIIGGTQPGKSIDTDAFIRLAERNPQLIKQRIADKKIETDAEILARIKKENKEAAERLKQKKDIKDPEDMATGGRAGFFLGSRNPRGLGLLRQILNYMSKKGKETGGFKGIDVSGLDMLRLSNPKRFNKLLEDVRGKVNIKEGIMGTDTVSAQQQSLREQRKGLTAEALQAAKDIKAKDIKIKRRIAEEAENTIIPRIKKQLMEDMGMSEEAAEKAARGIAESAQNMRLPDDPPIITKEGILELENVLKNLETGGKKKRDLNADGGRAGFKMGRRAFLKLMGGVGAGIGALKSGLLKLTGKEAAPQVAKEVVKQTTKSTPPPYFFELANKIKSLGKPDKVTYADRVEIHRYTGKNGDEYELVEDLSSGDIKITKDKLGSAGSGDEMYEGVMDRSVMEYKKGDVNVDPDKKIASKAPDEYDEYKVEFDVDGTEADADDMSEFIRKEIIEETTSEAPKIKKAAGGVAYMLGE